MEGLKLLGASKRNSSPRGNSGIVDDESKKAEMPFVDFVVKNEFGDCNSQGVSFPLSSFSAREVGVHRDHKLAQDRGHESKLEFTSSTQCLSVASTVDQPLENGSCAQYQAIALVERNSQETQVYPNSHLEQITNAGIQNDTAGPEEISVNAFCMPQVPKLFDVPSLIKAENSNVLTSSVEDGTDASPDTYVPALEVKKDIPNDFDDLDHIVLKERQKILLSKKLQGLANTVSKDVFGGLLEDIAEHSAPEVKEGTHSANGKPSADGGSLIVTAHSLPKTKTGSVLEIHKSDSTFQSKGMQMTVNRCEGQSVRPAENDTLSSSTLPTPFKVKDEPWDNNEFPNIKRNAISKFSVVKSEPDHQNEDIGDQVEHMRLRDRLKFMASEEDSILNSSNYASFNKVRSALKRSAFVTESAESISTKRPRKRKKTATDSIETALEEDAPGLLMVLLDKGDNFTELEAVISKLFSQRQSLWKLAPIRCTKASRVSYCLECLIALVEQTRYLQFQKWPVEWGWCRDLQSFIFVFERHNRIVLERPEYGYATYFFELVDSLPIDWQIKRLVTAMKLTSCSRISLIENKPLLVGDDLTEGEAKVLMEYGWVPNSGLGTMLNYSDRVVHDRKNDKDSSEWRTKIGKILVDGYNCGTMVAPNIPKKVLEYRGAEIPEIKLESS
ncbi:NAC domain-containing protein 8 [Quillaja saponaria]|uniref:NAC domain-containing protein 8 n=1 Tax=Quillaja saponaria TaxID=32244 RepID=A0AAD7PLE4_QUISA|nr:NAC domain-containing protein 8 [Quillaja saponaria]